MRKFVVAVLFCHILASNTVRGEIWDLGTYFDPNTATAVNGPFDYRMGPQLPGTDPETNTTPADLVPHANIFNTGANGFASVPGSGGFPTPMIMDNSVAQIAGLTESIASHSYITIAWTAPRTTFVDIAGTLTELFREEASRRSLFWHFDLNGNELSSGVVVGDQVARSFADGSGGADALEAVRVEAGDQLFLTVQDAVFDQVGIREDLFGLEYTITEVIPEPTTMLLGLLSLAGLVPLRRK